MSLDLAPLRMSKISQIFQRLLASSVKKSTKDVQLGGRKREEFLSLLSLLLNPAFSEGKLGTLKSTSLIDSSSLGSKGLDASLLLKNISSTVLYPSISAQVVATYIRRQMSSPQKLKDLDFRINLKTGISMLALFLFKRLPLGSSIRGLRIVCSGR